MQKLENRNSLIFSVYDRLACNILTIRSCIRVLGKSFRISIISIYVGYNIDSKNRVYFFQTRTQIYCICLYNSSTKDTKFWTHDIRKTSRKHLGTICILAEILGSFSTIMALTTLIRPSSPSFLMNLHESCKSIRFTSNFSWDIKWLDLFAWLEIIRSYFSSTKA